MHVIKRKVNNILRSYQIHSQKEADDLGMEYVYWKDAQEGDNALSDDGYVGVCLNRQKETN